MFSKILIANRGEIACRIIRTARRLGIRTVAVYSSADQDALHTAMADEALPIGPPAAAKSYLAIDALIDACRRSGAEAVHPGYGFLSEQGEFAERLAEAGVVFIGPPPNALRSMGDKIQSKLLARQAGVNTIPGCDGSVRDADHAVQLARELGYPVMLKATAGGGGKGMRRVGSDPECREAFLLAAREAHASFGDDRLFIERYIAHPRHIEIQVLADRHGNTIHLGERECSLQRRQQKVLEESPSPFLDPDTRQRMGAQAVALARAVGYESAGTVEFIVDPDRQFYFLEMNTRLQVEHPVTEMVTGLDLVEWMIRIAAGEPITFSPADIEPRGWSIESRVYAEDPVRNFLPSTGRLVYFLPPPESSQVRVDTGAVEGSEVSIYYDPLIAKVITHGATRDDAIARMRESLNRFCIRGLSHNIGFLSALLAHPRFVAGDIDTNLIADEYPQGFQPVRARPEELQVLAAVAAVVHSRYQTQAACIDGQLPGHAPREPYEWVVVLASQQNPVTIQRRHNGLEVELADQSFLVQSPWRLGQLLFLGTVNSQPIQLQVERNRLAYRLTHGGIQLDVMVVTPRAAELLARIPDKPARCQSKSLLSPMPGLLSQIFVNVGHEVKAGQPLVVVEAMKMANVLNAERDGRVASLLAAVGDTLSVDQPIMEFE